MHRQEKSSITRILYLQVKRYLAYRMMMIAGVRRCTLMNRKVILLRFTLYVIQLLQKHMDNRVLVWPRGKVLGGSSCLNAMVYIRGHAADYDRWAFKEGATGWSYAECLPYFIRLEVTCSQMGFATCEI
jgi:GMC oxidoreductase